jgi:hypothetical protein
MHDYRINFKTEPVLKSGYAAGSRKVRELM